MLYGYNSNYYYSYYSDPSYGRAFLGSSIMVIVGLCVCGAITKAIYIKKGREGGFAWGFFLGITGIIVALCRRPNYIEDTTYRMPAQSPNSGSALGQGSWKCACGRYNVYSTSSCVCGRSKREIMTGTAKPVVQESTPIDEPQNASALKEYKELLDQGIITQEEFDEKKKAIISH